MIIRESDIENYFIDRVDEVSGEVRKLKWIGRRNAPDRLVFLPIKGTWLIEFKRPGKKPTKAQFREIERINRAGGQATWINTYEGVDEFMKGCKVDIYV